MTIDTGGKPFGEPIMRIDEGEKMYKIYRFIPKINPGYHFEYRILTKLRKDGNLEVASYNYKVVDGKISKGNITRSENVPPQQMDGIVTNMKKRLEKLSPSNLEIIDLAKYKTLQEQIDRMKKMDEVDTQYLD